MNASSNELTLRFYVSNVEDNARIVTALKKTGKFVASSDLKPEDVDGKKRYKVNLTVKYKEEGSK